MIYGNHALFLFVSYVHFMRSIVKTIVKSRINVCTSAPSMNNLRNVQMMNELSTHHNTNIPRNLRVATENFPGNLAQCNCLHKLSQARRNSVEYSPQPTVVTPNNDQSSKQDKVFYAPPVKFCKVKIRIKIKIRILYNLCKTSTLKVCLSCSDLHALKSLMSL